jgi:hypothetical protein
MVRRSTPESNPFSSLDIQNVWTTLGFASSTARRADLPPPGIDSRVAVKVAGHSLSLASPKGQVIDKIEKNQSRTGKCLLWLKKLSFGQK